MAVYSGSKSATGGRSKGLVSGIDGVGSGKAEREESKEKTKGEMKASRKKRRQAGRQRVVTTTMVLRSCFR